MKRNLLFTRLLALVMLAGFCAHTAKAQTWEPELPYTEGFDDESHYTTGGTVPDGWLSTGNSPFETVLGSDWDIVPVSGESMLFAYPSYSSNREDVVYTPVMDLKAGTKYTLSVYLYMPGGSRTGAFKFTAGNAQTTEAQTVVLAEKSGVNITSWEKIEAEFTPDADGGYSFAMWACSPLSNDGFFGLDEFSIVPEETEPPVTWEPTIPYTESFDDETHYSGKEYLPIGWFASGDTPFITASITGVPAMSGEFYMVAPASILPNRKDIAYTPLLEMEGGKEYTLSFYLYMPGDESTASLKITVGQEQASDMHETVLKEISGRSITKWEKVELSFTPETDGEYCFSFWACSEAANDGYIAVDDFVLKAADDVVKPAVKFYTGNTLYSVINGISVVFPTQQVQMVNMTEGADSYEWSVTGGDAEISDPYAAEPTITFRASDLYDITLTATNRGGSSTEKVRFNVSVVPETGVETDAVQTTSDTADKIYQQADLPSYREDGTVQDYDTYEVLYDFVAGVNDYYRCFAERFEMPEQQEININSVTFNIVQYNLHIRTVSPDVEDDSKKEFALVIYPEKDGRPDITQPIYSEKHVLAEKFGDAGYYKPVMHSFQFEQPVTVKGTFYIALEFDELVLHPEGTSIERTFVGADTRRHMNGMTTLYVRPEQEAPGKDGEGEYCRADEFNEELEGYSFAAMAWISIQKLSAEDSAAECELYASADGNCLRICGLENNDDVRIYSASGNLMMGAKAQGTEMLVEMNDWNSGLYIISVNGQSVKFMK